MKKALLWGAVLFTLFILMGCKQETPDPPEPFTLTVTGIPGEIVIMGASLLLQDDEENSYATGIRSGNVFTFYYPDSGGRLPSDKAFDKKGDYKVALAEVDMQTFQEKDVYFYTQDGVRVLVSFPTDTPLPWSAFVKK